ncbi:MAG TPA: PA0069 family radical SAM protein, partial [Chthoniobacterales bacterium]
FEKLHFDFGDTDVVQEDPWPDSERPARATQYFRDVTKTIIARNQSPDVGFETSINPYRGCEHGCIYCFARPTHEYLGFSAGLDFESKIMVKADAPELLEAELNSPKWKPQVLVMSGVTDPYQPIERKLKITRRCLEVLAKFRNPVAFVTKNRLVTRDIDLLKQLADDNAAAVNISVTSLDPNLQRVLEPRTSSPAARLDAIAQLRAADVPVGVMVAPIIPGLTDHEVPAILAACAKAGAQFAGYTIVRLPWAIAPLFEHWLEEHFPDRKEKILGRIRDIRGGTGRMNDPNWGSRIKGQGIFADQVRGMFEVACRRHGMGERPKLSILAFRRPNEQLTLL